jgi:hypothetical protein
MEIDMARISASNVAERPVIGGKKSAKAVAGAQGHAWAVSIIRHAEQEGERQVAEVKSRKQRLGELMELGTEENLQARNDLTLALEKIKSEADAAKLSLNAYCDANPKAATVRVECAMWLKLADAVNKGFRGTVVDLTKPWADITKAATAHLDNMSNSTGSDGKTTNAGPRQRKAGRKATPLLDKVKQFTNSNIVDDKTMAVKPDVKLFQVVGLMLQRATIDQCNEVIAECIRIRDMKIAVEKEMADKETARSDAAKKLSVGLTDGTPRGNAGQDGTTTAGATVKVTKAKGKATTPAAPTPTGEHATAFDPRTQSRLRDGTIVNVPAPTMKTKTIRKSRATA